MFGIGDVPGKGGLDHIAVAGDCERAVGAGWIATNAGMASRAARAWSATGALISLIVLAVAAGLGSPSSLASSDLEAGSPTAAYANLPLAFVPNIGQSEKPVRFNAQGAGVSFGFTEDRLVIASTRDGRGHALHLRFVGASPDAKLMAAGRKSGTVNYLTSSERHANIPTYERLTYRDLWPGIDLTFRGARGELKYEFHVRAGANPADIRLAYAGADSVSVGAGGALRVGTPLGTLTDSRPRSFQRIGGRRTPVESRYALSANKYGFALGSYDRGRPLVIDPGLAYSTYLGGGREDGFDSGFALAVDDGGAAYVTGRTQGDFPTTPGAFDTSQNGGSDVFVAKLNPAGSDLVYSTYLGGWDFEYTERGGIAVDHEGAAYIAGTTITTPYPGLAEFPTTPGAYDRTKDGIFDAFVTKLSPDGSSLVYSTFLGGSDDERGSAIAVGPDGTAYVAGATWSNDFPTVNAVDGTLNGEGDAFVTKLNSTGSAVTQSTYLGGSAYERATGIAVDAQGNAYVAGETHSPNFPTTPNAFDTTFVGDSYVGDTFVTKFSSEGGQLDYSTYLGGSSYEENGGIAADAEGAAYVSGFTSSPEFPTTPGAYNANTSGASDAYVTKLDPTGSSLVYSTLFGGSDTDFSNDIAIDQNGAAYIGGKTYSTDLPTTAGAFDATWNGQWDAFAAKLRPDGSSLAYSTYLGGELYEEIFGVTIDPQGVPYFAGMVYSADYPTTPGAFQTTRNSDSLDAFVTKLEVNAPPNCEGVRPAPRHLWPPNHRLRPVSLVGATDPDGDPVTITIVGVTQDEPVGGAPDAQPGARADQIKLRAERRPRGNGRVYRVSFTASDASDECSGVVTVDVRRHRGRPAVDSAPPSYNSFGP